MKTLGFIGMGNMAGAIAAGILQKGLMKKEEVFAYAPHYEKLEANAEKIGFVPCKDLKGLTAKADTLVMACKPYQIEGVLSEIKEELKGKALISIAAGWNYDKYEEYLDKSTRFQFIMPNTPAMVGEGVLLFEEKNSLLPEEREEIKKLFSEYTHPVMNYNKEDYHSKDKRILAGDVAQELNVVVGEIGCPTCGATMKGGFVENKCPFCDQPYFK